MPLRNSQFFFDQTYIQYFLFVCAMCIQAHRTIPHVRPFQVFCFSRTDFNDLSYVFNSFFTFFPVFFGIEFR